MGDCTGRAILGGALAPGVANIRLGLKVGNCDIWPVMKYLVYFEPNWDEKWQNTKLLNLANYSFFTVNIASKIGQIMSHLLQIFQRETNSLSFSTPNFANSEPIEQKLNSIFANKYGKIQRWLRYYDYYVKLWIVL